MDTNIEIETTDGETFEANPDEIRITELGIEIDGGAETFPAEEIENVDLEFKRRIPTGSALLGDFDE